MQEPSKERVGAAMLRLSGCVKRNNVEDVLDVMDALGTDFMPVVDDLDERRVLGAISRDELTRMLGRLGATACVDQAAITQLPIVAEDASLDALPAVPGGLSVYVVVDGAGRLAGICVPPHGGHDGDG